MNARTALQLPALGEQLEGGFFHGVYLLDGQLWGEVTAPKAKGELVKVAWHPEYPDVPTAVSGYDGLVNTNAMAEAGSPLAQKVRALRIGGFDDWYIPALGSLTLQRINLQPLLPKAERFADAWYWSSTQYGRGYAFTQYFGDGYASYFTKGWEGCRARPVRRFLIG